MSVWEILGGIAMIIMSVAIVIFVLLQEGTKGGGLASLGADTDSFFSKNQGRTRDAMLFRATKVCAILFFVITVAVYAAYIYLGQ